jgi:anaerobic selenocysteine-containing dehydrogenase
MCGLTLGVDANGVVSVRGDQEDPLSRGYYCVKARALGDIHADPERLRAPMRRRGGVWKQLSWNEALDEAAGRIADIRRRHGPDAVALYLGNPVVHDYGAAFYAKFLAAALDTRHRFSAASVDGLPHLLTAFLMFGNQTLVPVPDLDRTMFFMCIGANPVVSNGSAMTAPGVARRLRALKARGGQCVVIDPRRTETADLAGRHLFIRPGTDALLLLALLSCVFEERLNRGRVLFQPLDGLDKIQELARAFPPETVSEAVGIPAEEIRRLARDFAGAPSAVCYGRVGVSTQEFGALACWLIQVLNIVTGNFERPGGMMFSRPALDLPALARWSGDLGHFDEFRSSVAGLPEFGGELPVAALADEIEAGRIRALITYAGNPVVSAPNGDRLESALERLDLIVSVDLYKNQTTRLAHIILPPTSPLERDHYPLVCHLLAVRNTAKYSASVFRRGAGALHDWEILLALKSRIDDDAPLMRRARKGLENAVLRALGPPGLLDLFLRLGPYGLRRILRMKRGLNLTRLRRSPHGVDLGALVPTLHRRLGRRPVELAPEPLSRDVARLRSSLGGPAQAELALRLIGRRQIWTNNSWMHDYPTLASRRKTCTLLIHPRDASARGIRDGEMVVVRSRTGAVPVRAEISDRMMQGVVSLPHGWSGARGGPKQSIGSPGPGASLNDLTDDQQIDRLAGTAAFSGVPVEVTRQPAYGPRAGTLSPNS